MSALRPQALFPVITNGSMASTITGNISLIPKLSMMSYTISWSNGSTPTGNLSVQVSNDYSQYENGSVRNSGTWTNVPLNYNGSLTTTIPISGNTGSGQIDIDQIGAYAIRLQYVPTGGSGTMQAIYCAKVS